jgi:hypothetical protein
MSSDVGWPRLTSEFFMFLSWIQLSSRATTCSRLPMNFRQP